MKIQAPKDYLVEIISSAPPDEQQALRNALSASQLTPMLAALIAQRLEAACKDAKPAPMDAGFTAKLDNLLSRQAGIEKRIEALGAPSVAKDDSKSVVKLAEQVQGLREDMRGVQDHLATHRPLSWAKVGMAALVLLMLGGIGGWYARIEYRQWQYERSQGGR